MEEKRDLMENEMASSQKSWWRENKQTGKQAQRGNKRNKTVIKVRDGSQAQCIDFDFEEQKVWEYLDRRLWFWPIFAQIK